jgi:hypothetical protein
MAITIYLVFMLLAWAGRLSGNFVYPTWPAIFELGEQYRLAA